MINGGREGSNEKARLISERRLGDRTERLGTYTGVEYCECDVELGAVHS